jgi:hypoxanthine phosphoribosyltransferase
MFLADLLRCFEGPVSCDFLGVASYGAGTVSSGQVKLTKDLDHPLKGRYVVVVEDILDTGFTLTYLLDILEAREPATLRTVCLLSKPSRRQVDVPVDYIGFEIDDRFVVGYGLDYDEAYRNLPYIGVIDEDA